MELVTLQDNWKMHRVGEQEWIDAVVPGSVYGDLLREGKMEDPFWKDNEDEALKLMEYDYEYSTSFACDSGLLASDEVILRRAFARGEFIYLWNEVDGKTILEQYSAPNERKQIFQTEQMPYEYPSFCLLFQGETGSVAGVSEIRSADRRPHPLWNR